MDITSKPNLKPMRQISEWEVFNGIYSATTATLNKGTFVTIATAPGNTNVLQNASNPSTPLTGDAGAWGEAPSYAVSRRWKNTATVRAANSGEVVLGVTLVDVKEEDKFGINYAYLPYSARQEKRVVLSGDPVPILFRGIIKTNNFSGTPNPTGTSANGAYVHGGELIVSAYSKATSAGKFLSAADADGYALFKVEC